MRIVEVPRHLTGGMRSAAIKLAVDDDSSAGTRPDGQRDQAAFSMAGTESPFADSGKVATVLDIDRQDLALQSGPQFAPLAVILGTILSTQAVYHALNHRHVTTDVVCFNGELTSEALSIYKIVFFPHAHILEETELAVLEDYVRAGATLIFGAWSAYRNKQHWCYWPFGATFYKALVGVRVADFTVVLAHETSSLKFAYETVPAPVFNEILEPTAKDVTVLAEYTSSYYAGRPAVSSRPIGKGRAVHFGAFYTPENATALLDALALDDPLVSWVEVPAGIEAVQRQSAQEGFYVFLNYTGCEQKLHFKETVYDLLETRKTEW
jgi:beta-galactosidase